MLDYTYNLGKMPDVVPKVPCICSQTNGHRVDGPDGGDSMFTVCEACEPCRTDSHVCATIRRLCCRRKVLQWNSIPGLNVRHRSQIILSLNLSIVGLTAGSCRRLVATRQMFFQYRNINKCSQNIFAFDGFPPTQLGTAYKGSRKYCFLRLVSTFFL